MKIKWIGIILLVLVMGCSDDKPKEVVIYKQSHVDFLKRYGWSIDRFASETKYASGTFQSFSRHMQEVKTKGKVDLGSYTDQEIIETGYVLREFKPDYNQIIAYIFESGGSIVGSYLVNNQLSMDKNGVYQIDDSFTDEMVQNLQSGIPEKD